MTKIFTCIVLLFCLTTVSAQLYQVPIEEKVANSTLIVEGKVIAKHSFWNDAHTLIVTANTVEVYKVFKGETSTKTIEVMTQGGTVGLTSLHASDLLELDKGELGIFMCYPNEMNVRQNGKLLYDVYSSSQGFFKYDKSTNIASVPFVNYTNVTETLYNTITQLTGRNFQTIDNNFSYTDFFSNTAQQQPNAPAISNFSPTTVNGGKTLDPATNLLTINGSGFGLPTGNAAILFDDCNNGTGGAAFEVAATDNLVVSWTDNQIQVRVPSRAGTGQFLVRDAANATANSLAVLTVNYSLISAGFDEGTGEITKQGNLMNDNGSGGYTLRFSSSTAGNGKNLSLGILPERATIDRAIATWKETCGINFIDGGTISTQVINNDNINLVTFDNLNSGVTLSAGVLAVCYSWHSACSPVSSNQYFKTEFDVIIRNNDKNATTSDNVSFTAGPCAPGASELDLETVVLHELGHAIGHSHINDGQIGFAPNANGPKLMNFAVSNQAKRTSLDYSAYVGGLYCAAPKGATFGGCAPPEIVQTAYTTVANDDCPASFPVTATASGTTASFNLIHATSNKYTDPPYNRVINTNIGTSITNNQFYAFRTNATGGNVTLTVSNYATNPADLSACTNPDENGVELSFYNLASCPATPNLYPSSLTYRTFRSNGVLATWSGLAANTTYLIMADGIANTKATFDLTFTGTALPIKFTGFTGEVLKESNLLKWTAEKVDNVARIDIERSADNNEFSSIGNITGNAVNNLKGTYNDFAPLSGKNYYRLKVTDKDGSITYSNIILLNRNDKFMVTMSPNPVRNVLNIKTSTTETGVYTFKLINTTGQTIVAKQLNVSSGNQNNTVNVSSVAKGAYHAVIYNKNGETIKSQIIVVE